MFELEFGIGPQFIGSMYEHTVLGAKEKTELYFYNIAGKVDVIVSLGSHFGLIAGAKAFVPITSQGIYTLAGAETKKDNIYTGFGFTPFVSAVYKF